MSGVDHNSPTPTPAPATESEPKKQGGALARLPNGPLPLGKPSFSVGVDLGGDAEHLYPQVAGNLEANACAVANQVHQ
ncbi:hypothetical protein JZ751_022191 [Albula glossodonta]|uniref:Uncharacterized protein n=1 Tax=Albula glossodonta TaxID=121402 RepID=A0A8T2NQN7_9TELE|nr:hypothetical protein JZ751_022191 [Albula glossodonta]